MEVAPELVELEFLGSKAGFGLSVTKESVSKMQLLPAERWFDSSESLNHNP